MTYLKTFWNIIKGEQSSQYQTSRHYKTMPKENIFSGITGLDQKNYIFLPARVEIEIKEFSVFFSRQLIRFRGTLRIKLPQLPFAQNQLKIFLFEDRKEIILDHQIAIFHEDAEEISWIYEINEMISWTPNLVWIPFDKHKFPIRVELASFQIGENRYYFNILNKDNEKEKEYFLQRKICEKQLEDFMLSYYQIRYPPIKDIIGERRVEYCPQITLDFKLIRRPFNKFVALLDTNFVFLIFTIFIFFTNNDFGPRVSIIILLALTIVAFFPSGRSGLAYLPVLAFMDLVNYVALVNLGLCAIETSIKRHYPDYETKGWWIAAVVLSFLVACIFTFTSMWRFIKCFKMENRANKKQKLIEDKIERIMRNRNPRPGIQGVQIIQIHDDEENEIRQDNSLTCLEKDYVRLEIILRSREEEVIPFI